MSMLAFLCLPSQHGKAHDIPSVKTVANLTIDAYEQITALQADRDTNNRRFVYELGGRFGFGSELNQLLLAFTYSFASRRQFIVDC